MANSVYDNEFVKSKENLQKNEEVMTFEKELVDTPEEQPVSYKRVDIDGGVVTDSSEAAYYKAVQVNDVIDNCLLGDFDEKGNYVVSPVIVEQLFKMKKVYVSTFEKSVFVESVREFDGYGKINFRLKWTTNNKGQKVVILELLEDINRVNGYFQNTNHVALLGISIDDTISTSAIYKYFNVVDKADDGSDDEGAERENNKDIIDILNRIAYFQIARVGQKKFMAKCYKDVYEKKVALLSKSKRGAYLLEDFNKEYIHCNNKFFKTTDVDYYKCLNQLLDAIIERNVDFIKDDKTLYDGLRQVAKQASGVFEATTNAVKGAIPKEEIYKQVNTLTGEETYKPTDIIKEQSIHNNVKTEAPKQEKPVVAPKTSNSTDVKSESATDNKVSEQTVYESNEISADPSSSL